MPTYWINFATAAAGPALACIITNPADVAKTRLNLERELKSTEMSRTTSSVRKMQQTYAAEGITGLQRGLQLAMVREASKNTFRIGLYQPLVDLGRGSSRAPGPAPFSVLMPAAMGSGAISALLTNPLDLLKTRLQLDGGHARGATASTSARSIASAIVVEEGVAGLTLTLALTLTLTLTRPPRACTTASCRTSRAPRSASFPAWSVLSSPSYYVLSTAPTVLLLLPLPLPSAAAATAYA